MVPTTCRTEDVASVIHPLITGRRRGCAAWMSSRIYKPGMQSSSHARHCARATFDSFVCELPHYNGTPIQPPDWLLGKPPATVGKFVAHWALSLSLSSSAPGQWQRYLLPASSIDSWPWLPPQSSCRAAGGGVSKEWTRADACQASDERAPTSSSFAAIHRTSAWEELTRLASSNSTSSGKVQWYKAASEGGKTEAGLWWAAQHVRLVRSAFGPCTRSAVNALRVESVGRRAVRESTRSPAVAIHIRRGDSCERWGEPGDASTSPRPCFATAHYVAAARRLLKVLPGRADGQSAGPARLLVASDSAEALREVATAAPEMAVFHVAAPRGEAWGAASEGATLGLSTPGERKTHFIEERNARGLVDRARVVASFYADLDLLASADAFVGTSASWVSRLALLAIAGESGMAPPHEFLDGPLGSVWTMARAGEANRVTTSRSRTERAIANGRCATSR